MNTQWEFAYNLAIASTGGYPAHVPEVRIEHIEMGCYRLSVDKAEIVLTATDLLDIMDWCLLHTRELTSQAQEAQVPARAATKAPVNAPASDGKNRAKP
jgi:hypothetical protein